MKERVEPPRWKREPDGSIVLIPIGRVHAELTPDGEIALLIRGLHPEDSGVESFQCTLSAEGVRILCKTLGDLAARLPRTGF